MELSTPLQREQLLERSRQRNWGLTLLLVGWLHLAAFLLCWYLTVGRDYNQAPGYVAIWVSEVVCVGLIFRLCGGSFRNDQPVPLERFIVRVWFAYFLLAFNLGTMNTLRGNAMFELFPAMTSLASFAFLVLTFAVDRRFFAAVLVMFAAGLLMASFFRHMYLVFGLAWWLVLNGIGLRLMQARVQTRPNLGEATSCR